LTSVFILLLDLRMQRRGSTMRLISLCWFRITGSPRVIRKKTNGCHQKILLDEPSAYDISQARLYVLYFQKG
jgi:hypothetical protein